MSTHIVIHLVNVKKDETKRTAANREGEEDDMDPGANSIGKSSSWVLHSVGRRSNSIGSLPFSLSMNSLSTDYYVRPLSSQQVDVTFAG